MPDSRPVRRPTLEDWAPTLITRHTAGLARPELLRAARALSARYVERRRDLPGRSVLDSAGKRAAFAVLYGPVHFATTRGIVEGLGLAAHPLRRLFDLGCGTGAASAGWAATLDEPPVIDGVDRDAWAVAEAGWTWRVLGLPGRARRGDLTAEAGRLVSPVDRTGAGTGVLAAFAVNELPPESRDLLLVHLIRLARHGAAVVVVEPISGRAAPWFTDWAHAFTTAGGRADEWRLPNTLPPALQQLDRDAGFDRLELTARSLALIPAS